MKYFRLGIERGGMRRSQSHEQLETSQEDKLHFHIAAWCEFDKKLELTLKCAAFVEEKNR